jgi:hypothetical protein
LGVIEIGRNGNDRTIYGLSQRQFRIPFELLQLSLAAFFLLLLLPKLVNACVELLQRRALAERVGSRSFFRSDGLCDFRRA